MSNPVASKALVRVSQCLNTYAMLSAWLIAGTFFVFSDFVMSALGRVDTASGVVAMQAMNISVEEGVFIALANSMIPLGVAFIIIWAGFRGSGVRALGGFIFMIGAAAPTLIGNITLNVELAGIPASSLRPEEWTLFINDWLYFNNIRLAATLMAAICFTFAVFQSQNEGPKR